MTLEKGLPGPLSSAFRCRLEARFGQDRLNGAVESGFRWRLLISYLRGHELSLRNRCATSRKRPRTITPLDPETGGKSPVAFVSDKIV